jgi:hypothetical protein
VNNIFSYFEPYCLTFGLTVTGLARIYCNFTHSVGCDVAGSLSKYPSARALPSEEDEGLEMWDYDKILT